MSDRIRARIRSAYNERGNKIVRFYTSGILQELMASVIRVEKVTATWVNTKHIKEIWDTYLTDEGPVIYVHRGSTPISVSMHLTTLLCLRNEKYCVNGVGKNEYWDS